MAVSAMNRNGEASSSILAPSTSDGAVHSCSSALLARRLARNCSKNLVIMMYQLPIDISTSRISTKRATKSPFFQRAPRPYGLLTVSDVAGWGGGTASSVAEPAVCGAAVAVAVADAVASLVQHPLNKLNI